MRKKNLKHANLENLISLFSMRLKDFKGESRRSYQKAFSSFQIYIIGHYKGSDRIERSVVENWLVDCFVQGLSSKTVSFYLDKVTSLYSRVAHNLEGGKDSIFKDVKIKLKSVGDSKGVSSRIRTSCVKMKSLWQEYKGNIKGNILLDEFIAYPSHSQLNKKESLRFLWAAMALDCGIRADWIKTFIGDVPRRLPILNLCENYTLTEKERKEIIKKVYDNLCGESIKWYAMRLRPKIKFDEIITRFSRISGEVKIPELFYPSEEITRKVGRKVLWKDKPLIHDVIFFRSRKSDIYPLFSHIYDLAWCYRTPGGGFGNYASIPDQAMTDFKNALGILSPDFELKPAGEMALNPGDEVIIVNGRYLDEHARILKKPSFDAEGNKIYRVSLLHGNGRWDIGIDARLIKKV